MNNTKMLTDKTWAMIFKDNSRYYLTKNQAAKVCSMLTLGERNFFDIEGELFSTDSISRIVKVENIDFNDRIKRGEFQCDSCGQWLQKGQRCGNCNYY